MFDDTYYLAIVRDDNRQRFCVGVPQLNGRSRLIETEEVIYWLLKSFQRESWRQERQTNRHLERIALSDEELADRCGAYVPSPEDMLYRRILSDGLQKAFLKLPPVQARRFLLHHGLGLTYREIGEAEGCTDRAVRHSVSLAKKKLQRILR